MATNYQYTDSHAESEGRKVGRKILVLRAVLRPSALRHNKRSTQKTTEGRLRRNRRTTFASLTSVRHNGPCVAAKPPLIKNILLSPYAQGGSVQMRGVLPIGAFWGSTTENCDFLPSTNDILGSFGTRQGR